MLFLINELFIPALESAINALVRFVQTKAFWITLGVVVTAIFGISVVTDLSMREVVMFDNISNMWGLMDTDDAAGATVDSGATVDKYRGGATPHSQ